MVSNRQSLFCYRGGEGYSCDELCGANSPFQKKRKITYMSELTWILPSDFAFVEY